MAELLIRIRDKPDMDPLLVDQVCRAGDVVVACPNGWEWSRLELSQPFWRILKVPDMTLAEAEHLASPPIDGSRRRAVKLDLSGFSRSFMDDDSRATKTLTTDAATVRSATQQRAVVSEIVIG